MKKLLLTTFLLALCCLSAFSLTLEEMEAAVGAENVTSNDIAHARFLKVTPLRGGKVGLVPHVWLEIQDAQVDEIIPPEFLYLLWDVVYDSPVTLRDFLVHDPIDLPGPTCLIYMCARDLKGGNVEADSSWHIAQWALGVGAYGYTVDNFLDHEQMKALLPEGE